MDELSGFKDAPRQLRQRESAVLKEAAQVFAGGPSLFEARRGLHHRVHCFPSAVDAAHFSPANLDHGCEHAISPTKTLEYMAGDKPVVSTPVPDVISLYGAAVAVAPATQAFVQACEAVLTETAAVRCRRNIEMLATVSMHAGMPFAIQVHGTRRAPPPTAKVDCGFSLQQENFQ